MKNKSLEELCQRVEGALGPSFVHNPKMRIVNLYQICPDRAVRITGRHMEILREKRRRGGVSERQMVDWGTMLTVNACYFWEREDEELADYIIFLRMDLVPKE
jgi:hypothetical protein